jgi:hypothetical protein
MEEYVHQTRMLQHPAKVNRFEIEHIFFSFFIQNSYHPLYEIYISQTLISIKLYSTTYLTTQIHS